MNSQQLFNNFTELAIRFNSTRVKDDLMALEIYKIIHDFENKFKSIVDNDILRSESIDDMLYLHKENLNELSIKFMGFCNSLLLIEAMNKHTPIVFKAIFTDGSEEAHDV